MIIGLCLVFNTAQANDTLKDKSSSLDAGTFSFQLENDLFSGTDQHYTNGVRFSWLSPSGETFSSLATARSMLESLPFVENFGDPGKSTRFGFSLGQDMYTPEDRYTTELLSTDRPYGAWLYGAVSLHSVSPLDNGASTLQSVELALGVIGPMAYGEESQDLVHEVRLIDTFEGWDNQIKNEPGIALRYENKWRLSKPADLIGFGEFDLIPRMGLSLGNVTTHAGAGGVLRWGWNLPENFGPPSLIHGGAPFISWDGDTDDIFSAYIFATADGNYVAHNIFLDGNTFTDSHSVKRRPVVGDFSMGLSLLAGPVNLTYTTALRTREFEGQNRNSRYGSLTLSMQNPF
jgi:hypothetical protein